MKDLHVPYSSAKIHPAAETAHPANPNNQQSTSNGITTSYPSTSPPIDLQVNPSLFSPPPYSQPLAPVRAASLNTQKSSAVALDNLDPIGKKKRQFYQEFKERLATKLHVTNDTDYGIFAFNKDGYTRLELPPGVSSEASCLNPTRTIYNPTKENERQRIDRVSADCCCSSFLSKAFKNMNRSNEIPIGIDEFATRIALNLTYRFQDQLPDLPEGKNSLIKSFEQTLTNYVYGSRELYKVTSRSRHGDDVKTSFYEILVPPKQRSVNDVIRELSIQLSASSNVKNEDNSWLAASELAQILDTANMSDHTMN